MNPLDPAAKAGPAPGAGVTPAVIDAEIALELAAHCIARLSRLVLRAKNDEEAQSLREERSALMNERLQIDAHDRKRLAVLKQKFMRRAEELKAMEEGLH